MYMLSYLHYQVANDAQGRGILEELKSDGVDVSFFAVMNM